MPRARLRIRLTVLLLPSTAATLTACRADRPTEPIASSSARTADHATTDELTARDRDTLEAQVRLLAAGRGIVPLPRPQRVRPALAQLGRALFFDRILSGNRDIACSTCHLAGEFTGDGKSLSIGQGGTGLGPTRVTAPHGAFIPRNAPPLFNLHAVDALFWDGRVARGPDGRIVTPAGAQLTPAMETTLEFGPVSALALFPVTNRLEMRAAPAQAGPGNDLAAYADTDFTGVWRALMRRLGAVPAYRQLFRRAYPGTPFRAMTFAHAANAVGGFLVQELSAGDTPWDRFLAGDGRALSRTELEGARDFMSLKCSVCHSGATFSDGQFHDVALPQVGPGEGDGADGRDDFGRMRVTGAASDRYRFRTTPLRNVALTGPYGHAGQFATLRAFVDHYSESDRKLAAYDVGQLEPALRGMLVGNQSAVLAARDTLLRGVVLSPDVVDRLTAYMGALTSPSARHLGRLVPERVPSGLPVDGAPPSGSPPTRVP